MLCNEKGFTYPLTFGLLIMISTVLTIGIEQFLIEKKMLKESEMILKQDYYLLSTVQKLEHDLASTEMFSETGIIRYYDGEVVYTIDELTSSILEINLKLKTGKENIEIMGIAYYDKDLQRIFKWIEKS
jgi:hypothetical protein